MFYFSIILLQEYSLLVLKIIDVHNVSLPYIVLKVLSVKFCKACRMRAFTPFMVLKCLFHSTFSTFTYSLVNLQTDQNLVLGYLVILPDITLCSYELHASRRVTRPSVISPVLMFLPYSVI